MIDFKHNRTVDNSRLPLISSAITVGYGVSVGNNDSHVSNATDIPFVVSTSHCINLLFGYLYTHAVSVKHVNNDKDL